ncbi:MAG: 30S ribosome-binding factor RbfA [Candidatus Omnitrophica bacterium]|nr:30S ribosome-binding factor RbfA [Candidatus Omnitrophota bacterium]
MSRRSERVEEAIRREASLLIKDELRDPRIGFVTVTRATVSEDLREAVIYYTVLGDDKAKKNAQAGLKSALAFMRNEIGHRLKLKFIPNVRMVEDTEILYMYRIEETLRKIKEEKKENPHGDQ